MQGLYDRYVRLGYYENRHPVRYGIGASIAMAVLLWGIMRRTDTSVDSSARSLRFAIDYAFGFGVFRVLLSRSGRRRDRFARWSARHPEPEMAAAARDRLRRSVALVVLLAVVASVVAVLVARRGSNGSGALSIRALAATTQKQSARIRITQALPSDQSDRHPGVIVLTGIADFRAGDGRFESTMKGESGPAAPFGTDLFVAGRHYVSIGATSDVPVDVRRTKKWIDVDTKSVSLQSSGLNPFDPLGLFNSLDLELEDRGKTELGGQTVERYTGTSRVSSPPASGHGEKETLAFDVYVDRHNRVEHVQIDESSPGVRTTAQVDYSDYGVRVDVKAPPADDVVRLSDLPSGVAPTPTSGRAGVLVLRQDIDSSAAECKKPGTLANTAFRGQNGPELCTLLGETVVTGDDVTSAVARPVAASSSGWCVAPILTANALADLRAYVQANEPVPDLFVISRGKFLGAIEFESNVHNGDCWIATDRMDEATARALATQLSRH